ncbi:MAG: non-canonical purine NTP pyrophosphatase [Chloroflexi bacterium]|uniref:non-canonical purine NTP pyrophosphatase n=1 Tax=Candidatus Flexifilum breve TaxID=3140694 RepID=UPI003135744A|nr:non-canonical purine NTP pyrophosphatase [Chloroflexota bacterium]
MREYQALLSGLNLTFLSLRDVNVNLDVPEPYETFTENAEHKAREYAKLTGMVTLTDDSGLVVDALGGRPGVYSARYAPGTDADRYTKLLEELVGVPEEGRTARFVCAAALAAGDGSLIDLQVGTVEGKIAFAPGDGSNGFGFDPVFIPNGFDVTLNALTMDEKNAIDHRGNALRLLIPTLRRITGQG